MSHPFSSIESKSDIFAVNETKIKNIGIFGLSLFKDSPTTFAPIDLAPAPLDYIIGPGDELRVQLYGNNTINRLVPVNRKGILLFQK